MWAPALVGLERRLHPFDAFKRSALSSHASDTRGIDRLSGKTRREMREVEEAHD